jgi:hypothetical protein
LSQSAKLYQERRAPDSRTTRRRPGSRIDLGSSKMHALPLTLPYPSPDAVRAETQHYPDGGRTELWPHGEMTIE